MFQLQMPVCTSFQLSNSFSFHSSEKSINIHNYVTDPVQGVLECKVHQHNPAPNKVSNSAGQLREEF